MVLGSPPVAPRLPALRAGELMPPPHLFRPPPQTSPSTVDPMNSIKPPLEWDIALYVSRSPHRRSHTRFHAIHAIAISFGRFTALCCDSPAIYVSSSRSNDVQTQIMLLCHVTGRRRDAYLHGWNVDRWRLSRKGKAAFTSPFVQYPRVGSPDQREGYHLEETWKIHPDHHRKATNTLIELK